MITNGLHRIPLVLAAVLVGFSLPVAAQTFAITAPPVTTSSSGEGTIQFTVSGIPFAGQLVISCQYAGAASVQEQDKLPVCGAGPVFAFSVTAGQTVTKTISLIPWGAPMPLAAQDAPRKGHRVPASGFLIAGALLLGFGLRRRRGWPSALLFILGALAVASGVSACGGSSNAATAGTYSYTVTAALSATSPAILSAATSTTVKVTIP